MNRGKALAKDVRGHPVARMIAVNTRDAERFNSLFHSRSFGTCYRIVRGVTSRPASYWYHLHSRQKVPPTSIRQGLGVYLRGSNTFITRKQRGSRNTFYSFSRHSASRVLYETTGSRIQLGRAKTHLSMVTCGHTHFGPANHPWNKGAIERLGGWLFQTC